MARLLRPRQRSNICSLVCLLKGKCRFTFHPPDEPLQFLLLFVELAEVITAIRSQFIADVAHALQFFLQ